MRLKGACCHRLGEIAGSCRQLMRPFRLQSYVRKLRKILHTVNLWAAPSISDLSCWFPEH